MTEGQLLHELDAASMELDDIEDQLAQIRHRQNSPYWRQLQTQLEFDLQFTVSRIATPESLLSTVRQASSPDGGHHGA